MSDGITEVCQINTPRHCIKLMTRPGFGGSYSFPVPGNPYLTLLIGRDAPPENQEVSLMHEIGEAIAADLGLIYDRAGSVGDFLTQRFLIIDHHMYSEWIAIVVMIYNALRPQLAGRAAKRAPKTPQADHVYPAVPEEPGGPSDK